MAEELALGGREREGAAVELERPAHVVEERGGDEDVAPKPRVQVGGVPAERRNRDRVLEEPARVAVVSLGRGGKLPQAGAKGRVLREGRDDAHAGPRA